MDVLAEATPLQLAALWRLNLLSSDDISAVCMRWLEENLDEGDADIGAFAGRRGLTFAEAGPAFSRALQARVGRQLEEDEAILLALHLHLAAALKSDDLIDAVGLVVANFASRVARRLVRNPRRARDHPTGDYAQQELGLEYIYSGYYAFDDIQWMPDDERKAAEAQLMQQLRDDVRELHDHLEGEIRPAAPAEASD